MGALGSPKNVGWLSDEQRLKSFALALDRLHRAVEAELGAADAEHIARVRAWSSRLEVIGRGLIHFSLSL